MPNTECHGSFTPSSCVVNISQAFVENQGSRFEFFLTLRLNPGRASNLVTAVTSLNYCFKFNGNSVELDGSVTSV
jgi:hypothetical protein